MIIAFSSLFPKVEQNKALEFLLVVGVQWVWSWTSDERHWTWLLDHFLE